jgi:tetratricopeptide (TPR) repeat protein
MRDRAPPGAWAGEDRHGESADVVTISTARRGHGRARGGGFALALPLVLRLLVPGAASAQTIPASPAPAAAGAPAPDASVAPTPAIPNSPELDALEALTAAAPDDLRPANAYRQAVIRLGAYDRALAFFAQLTADHPQSANAWLGHGYAYVDKIPVAGSIGRVLLANEALTRFSRALEIERSWLGLYTRGNSYLYWPKVFGRGPLAVADLEEAVALARSAEPRRRVYVRSWIALGDAYWRTDQRQRARETWREAAALFPGEPGVAERLALADEAVEPYLYERLDPNLRVDTDLTPLWEEPQ